MSTNGEKGTLRCDNKQTNKETKKCILLANTWAEARAVQIATKDSVTLTAPFTVQYRSLMNG